MPVPTGMTIAICTRDRHDDLGRCIASIAAQCPDFPAEVIVVDDGDGMPESLLARFAADLGLRGIVFRYVRKRQPGLLLSRIEAIGGAHYERILFLDDDAELEEGYLSRLSGLYDAHPEAAGFGGVDSLLRSHFKWDLFCRLILYAANQPGRLSPSGFGGSMTRWSGRTQSFETEYLAGCNMSFRTSALQDVQPVDWLSSYSLGEDLYLSHLARSRGKLWIDPGLRMKHHQSPVSRDKEDQVAYTEVVNHYRLLQVKQAGAWRFAIHLWTSFGLYVRSLLKKNLRHKAPGYRRALRFVAADDCRRLFHESFFDHGDGRPYG